MTLGQPGCREQEFLRYPAKGLGFSWSEVDEVRRCTTGDALAAWHVGAAFFHLRATRATKPRREFPSRQILALGDIFDVGQFCIVAHDFWWGIAKLNGSLHISKWNR